MQRFGGPRDNMLRVDNGLVLGEGGLETVLPLVTVTGAAMSLLDDELEVRTRDGDVIRAKVSGHEEGEAIVAELAVSKVHGTWLASLHQRRPAARWVEWPWLTAVGAALLGFVLAAPFVSVDLAAAIAELVREASGGYRTAMLPKEQALAVLEDGRAPGELRIGAALALTVGGRAGEHTLPRGLDADTALRLRIAVETCVNQDVCTALRDAIHGDLE